jgi:transposase InsO family protein
MAGHYRVHINTVKTIFSRGKRGDYTLHSSERDDYRSCARGYARQQQASEHIQKRLDREAIIRYEKEYAGELGHIDIHKLKNIKGEDPKKKKYQIALLDDATRLIYSEVISNKRACTATDFTRRALRWFHKRGITFRRILSDNGLEFTAHTEKGKLGHCFEKMLAKEGITHKYTKVRRPQTNRKIERWWQTLERECFRKHTFASWAEYYRAHNDWLTYYNFKRKHSGIKGMTPW